MYITIQSFNNMHGSKPLKLGGLIKLVKEPDNKYDAEAIACEMRYFGKIGYVANSTNSMMNTLQKSDSSLLPLHLQGFSHQTNTLQKWKTPKATYTTYQTIWERLTLNSLRKT